MNIRNSNTKLLLKCLATAGAVTLLSLVNPQLPYFLMKTYIKNRKFRKDRFLQDLKRLQRRELVDYNILPDGQVKIRLQSAGRKKVLQFELDEINIKRPRNWDKKWRLVVFDIPVKKRTAANAFNLKLKILGFHNLQKSIFIYPFPCEDEVEFVASMFNIKDHILILNVSDFIGEEKLKRHFKI